MRRLAAALAVLGAMSCAALGAGDALREADDSLARWLESRGLDGPLIDLLERRLAASPTSERLPIAERLAAMYARRLEQATGSEERAALERRARALLDNVPDADGADLRLNLHRISYLRAEQIAERWRLRMASAAEVEEAERTFRALASDLAKTGATAHRRVDALEKQEEATRDLDLALVRDALSAARRQRSMAMYLAGWSNAYLAELTGSPATAIEGSKQFGWLLNAAPGEAPTIERFPAQTLEYEHVARAALGAGTCASLRGDEASAMQWFDVVESSNDTAAAVREQVFARRIAAAARAEDWITALKEIGRRRGTDETGRPTGKEVTPLSPNEARLAAVSAFEARSTKSGASLVRRLQQVALGDLVEREQLSAVVDLARRYGTESLGGEGFIVDYVRGLLAHQKAREAHRAAGNAEAPTGDPAVVKQYLSAAALLGVAETAGDADRFPAARADASMMHGLSLYFASEGDGARERAAEAAERLLASAGLAPSPERRADAMWMAIRALERAATLKAAGEPAERREALMAAFIAEFPADERASMAVIQRSASGSVGREEAIETLLKTPEGSAMREAAQREAARLLYLAARESAEDGRPSATARFVETAWPLFERDCAAAAAGDWAAGERAVTIGRQLMDACLPGVGTWSDARTAEAAIDALSALWATGSIDLGPHQWEIAYRRLQAALALGDIAAAEEAAGALAAGATGAAARFAQAGSRLMLQRTAEAWRGGRQDEETARAIVRHGAHALLGLQGREAEGAAQTIRALVAEAASWLWANRGDSDARDVAQRMLRAGLEEQPANETLLRRMADLSESTGDLATAIECWKKILSGKDVASDGWFEAKWRVIGLLARTDPATARHWLSQHQAVFPDMGPAPWGDRLREILASLAGGEGGAS